MSSPRDPKASAGAGGKLSRQAMVAAGFPAGRTDTAQPDYPSAQDDYPWVIVTQGGSRLAVSPEGRAYLPQVRRDGAWHCGRPFLNGGALGFFLEVSDAPWPDEILAALAGLPDDPSDCLAQLRAEKVAG